MGLYSRAGRLYNKNPGVYGRVDAGDPGLGAFSVIKRDVEILNINPVNGYITLDNDESDVVTSEFYGGLIDKDGTLGAAD